MKKYILFPLLFLAFHHSPLSTLHSLHAQGRFDASLFAGLNVCQVDGDGAGRYNHPGLRAGIGTSFALGDDRQSPWRMVVELAYTQKGSHINESNGEISLQYIEVPLMLSYNALNNRLRLAAGVAPAVKIGCSVTFGGSPEPAHEALYRTFDWLPVTVAAEYLFTDHLGLSVRWQNSMLSVYDGGGTYRIIPSNHGAFNRLISFGLTYRMGNH